MATTLPAIPARLEKGEIVSRDDAAALLCIKPQTLAVWHSTGRYALPVIKVGRRAMYRLSDIEAFIAARTVDHSA